MSTPLLNRQNTPVSTRYQLKNTLICTVTNPILSFKLVYRHPQWFLWAFRARERLSWNGFTVLRKTDRVFVVQQKNWQTNKSDLSFVSTFSKSVTYPCQFFAILSGMLSDKRKLMKLNLLRTFKGPCQTINGKNTCYFLQFQNYLRFYSFTFCHLGKLCTAAQKVYAVSRSRLCLNSWLKLGDCPWLDPLWLN